MKRIIAAMTAALLMVGVVSSGAIASSSTASWKVYTYNSSGQAYSSKQATTSTGASFAFTTAPNTALLTTAGKSLTGDLTGKTLTATFEITGNSPVFTYYGQATSQCSTPASVRLYFTGIGEKSPGFYSNYWWSNPVSSAVLAVTPAGTTVTLTASLGTTAWSNWNGKSVSDVPAEFAAAVASVSSVGLSFGGGCFFSNGVGVSSGSAQFALTSYTVTQ